jgi:hypothetical protein
MKSSILLLTCKKKPDAGGEAWDMNRHRTKPFYLFGDDARSQRCLALAGKTSSFCISRKPYALKEACTVWEEISFSFFKIE